MSCHANLSGHPLLDAALSGARRGGPAEAILALARIPTVPNINVAEVRSYRYLFMS